MDTPRVNPNQSPNNVPQAPQGPPLNQTPPGKHSRKHFWVSLVSTFVVASLVIVGALWFYSRSESEGAAKSVFRVLPDLSAAAVIPGTADARIVLEPKFPSAGVSGPVLQLPDLNVVVVSDGENRTLVAMKEGQQGLPVWTAPLATSATDCQVSGQYLACGEDDVVDLSNGWPVSPAVLSSSTAGSLGGATDTGADSPEAGALANESAESGAAEVSGNGAETPAGPESTQSDAGTSSGSEQGALTDADFTTGGLQLGTSPTEDLPYSLNAEHALTDKNGEVLASFDQGSVWALNDRVLGGDTWVISDGRTVVAVKGEKVLWTVTLAEDAAEVNGFTAEDGTAPNWYLDRGALVMADRQGVFALDLKDGSQLWKVSTQVDSWVLSANALLVTSGRTVYALKFPVKAESAETAQSADEELAPVEIPTVLSADNFSNGTFAVPQFCREFSMGSADAGPATFVNGFAQGYGGTAGVTLAEVAPLFAAGQPYSVVSMSCDGGGLYSYPAWGIYDSEMNLVAEGEPGRTDGVTGVGLRPWMDRLLVNGSTFSYSVEGLELMSQSGGTSANAVVTVGFDGSTAEILDVLYAVPSGLVRQPNQEKVQQIYDLIAANDPEAANYVSESAQSVLNGALGAQATIPTRGVVAPEGATIGKCTLAGSAATKTVYDYLYSDPDGIKFPSAVDVEPGDFLCGINSSNLPEGISPSDGGPYGQVYMMWLVVTSDESGNPYVKEVARHFS